MEAGDALCGAVEVLFLTKGLKLPQVQHGFHHQLQRTDTTGPTSPRTLSGVRKDLAYCSVLERNQDTNKTSYQLFHTLSCCQNTL